MAITCVPVRARVELAGIDVETPYVLSFNVRKARGQFSAFDVSLKVSHDDVVGKITGGPVVIRAGSKGNLKKIFTGYVKTAKISPCYDDPMYVMLSASGTDVLSLLQGKRYTRRCRATRGTYCTIQGVARTGLKSGKFAYQNDDNTHDSDNGVVNGHTTPTKATTNSDLGSVPVNPDKTSDQKQGVSFSVLIEGTGS